MPWPESMAAGPDAAGGRAGAPREPARGAGDDRRPGHRRARIGQRGRRRRGRPAAGPVPHPEDSTAPDAPGDPTPAVARAGRVDLLAGEAQLEARAAAGVPRDRVVGMLGWAPAPTRAGRGALAPHGGAIVALPIPRGTDPPTLVHAEGGLNRSFAPLVDTYATVPYADVDPTVLAGLAFMLMFGMMFADAGQGALLLAGGLLLRAGRLPRLAGVRRIWPFVVGAAVAAILFGVLFGEFFGPTGCSRPCGSSRWRSRSCCSRWPLGVGATLLAGAYVLGIVNRWREGGWRAALVADLRGGRRRAVPRRRPARLGAYAGAWLVAVGVAVAVGRSGAGLRGSAGRVRRRCGRCRRGRGGVVRRRDPAGHQRRLVRAAGGVRPGPRRPAGVVWEGTTGLWAAGGLRSSPRSLVFVVGNVLTFVLEGVVAGVQALRLEYYELFSRVFVFEGRAFQPWSVPLSDGACPVTVWLVCLPVLIVVALATRVALRTRSGAALRVFLGMNVVLASAGSPLLAAGRRTGPGGCPGHGRGAGTPPRRRTGRRCWALHRRRRLLDRGSHRRGLHRGRGAGHPERAPGALRPGHGDRRPGRGDRHLRPDHRDHPDRQCLTWAGWQRSASRCACRACPWRGSCCCPATTRRRSQQLGSASRGRGGGHPHPAGPRRPRAAPVGPLTVVMPE